MKNENQKSEHAKPLRKIALTEEQKMRREQAKKERESELNKIIIVGGIRPKTGKPRIAFSFQNCPSRTEQHSWKETDLNYLMAKYKPDELAAYIAARNSHRTEIIGHDFSKEPDLQTAKNAVYDLNQMFDSLPDHIKRQFNGVVDFLKFIDNPSNEQKMLRMGLMTDKQLNEFKKKLDDKKTDQSKTTPTPPTPTKDEEKETKAKA